MPGIGQNSKSLEYLLFMDSVKKKVYLVWKIFIALMVQCRLSIKFCIFFQVFSFLFFFVLFALTGLASLVFPAPETWIIWYTPGQMGIPTRYLHSLYIQPFQPLICKHCFFLYFSPRVTQLWSCSLFYLLSQQYSNENRACVLEWSLWIMAVYTNNWNSCGAYGETNQLRAEWESREQPLKCEQMQVRQMVCTHSGWQHPTGTWGRRAHELLCSIHCNGSHVWS